MSRYVLPFHPMLSCVVSCTEHLFCKLRHDLVAILFNEFPGESVHRLRRRFQLFHHKIRVGHGVALSLEAALHGAHIGVGVKSRLKLLCVDFAVFVQDMCIDFRDHVNLCMTGISLGGGFEIPFVQFQLVGRAGVTQGMEYHIGQAGRLFKAFKLVADDVVLSGPSCFLSQYQIVVYIVWPHELFQPVLLILPVAQDKGKGFGKPYLTDAAFYLQFF